MPIGDPIFIKYVCGLLFQAYIVCLAGVSIIRFLDRLLKTVENIVSDSDL